MAMKVKKNRAMIASAYSQYLKERLSNPNSSTLTSYPIALLKVTSMIS